MHVQLFTLQIELLNLSNLLIKNYHTKRTRVLRTKGTPCSVGCYFWTVRKVDSFRVFVIFFSASKTIKRPEILF